MKKIVTVLLALSLTGFLAAGQSVLERMKERTKNAVEQAVGEKVEKGVNDVLNGNIGKKNKKEKEAEAENNKAAQAQVKEMLTWVERYDKASVEAKHMIIAALVDRIEIGENYEVHIQFKVSAEQFIRQTA